MIYLGSFMNFIPTPVQCANASLVASEATTTTTTAAAAATASSCPVVDYSENTKGDTPKQKDEVLPVHDCLSKNRLKRKRCPDRSTGSRYDRDVNAMSAVPVIPSSISKRMELNEWAISLLFIDHVHPSQQLLELMREYFVVDHTGTNRLGIDSWHNNHVVPIINIILSQLLSQYCHDLKQSDSAQFDSIPPRISVSTNETTIGTVVVDGAITANIQFLKAMMALYYHALEAILYCTKVQVQNKMVFNAETTTHQRDRITSPTTTTTTTTKDAITAYLRHESFHRALIACCYICVAMAVQYTGRIRPSKGIHSIPVYTLLQNVVQCSSYEFIKVLDYFFLPSLSASSEAYNQLGSPFIFTLPHRIVTELHDIKQYVLDSLLWACNSPLRSGDTTFAKQIHNQLHNNKTNIDSYWPPKCLALTLPDEVDDDDATNTTITKWQVQFEQDSHDDVNMRPSITTPQHIRRCPAADYHTNFDVHVVEHIIDTILSMAQKRIIAICKELGIVNNRNGDELMTMVVQQIYVVFRYILRNHIYLFYDRHVDHWILCTIYGVTRSLKYPPELKFAQIISAYAMIREQDLGTATCQQIVRHVRLVNTDDPYHTLAPRYINTQEQEMGNVISLYNKVFIPTMKEYLLNSTALRSCSIQLSKIKRLDDRTDMS
jgi:hypothetical protein